MMSVQMRPRFQVLLAATAIALGAARIRGAEPFADALDEFLVIINPTKAPANITLEYYLPDIRSPRHLSITVRPMSRSGLRMRETPDLRDYVGFLKASSDAPFVVDRATGLDAGGVVGAGQFQVTPVVAPFQVRYFAEGRTGPADTWLILTNPLDVPAAVEVEYYGTDGRAGGSRHSLPALGRSAVHLNEISGLGDAEVGFRVTADSPILAERSMQWNPGPPRAGKGFASRGRSRWAGTHTSMGMGSLSEAWYLPDCRGGKGFKTFLSVLNPGPVEARLGVRLWGASGAKTKDIARTVKPWSRLTIPLHEEMDDDEASVRLAADVPLAVEKVLQWDVGPVPSAGGVCTPGATAPSTLWYVAEGYTGGDFEMDLVLMNPNTTEAHARIEFLIDGSRIPAIDRPLEAGGRLRLPLKPLRPLTGDGFGEVVTADLPIVVERVLFISAGGFQRAEGHGAMGIPFCSPVWYIPRSFGGKGLEPGSKPEPRKLDF